jgi:hypothetical protein
LSTYGSAIISYPSTGPLQFFVEKINAHSTNNYRNRLICCSYGNSENVFDEVCKNQGGAFIGQGSATDGTPKRWYAI